MKSAGSNFPVRRDRNLFEDKPVKLAGFTLHARGVEVIGRPSIEKWGAAMQFAMACEESSPFWVGELWNYANEQHYDKKQVQQALATIGRVLALKTLDNHGSIAKKVTAKAKELAPSIAHADIVTSLPPDEQVEWMDKASSTEMTVRDLRLSVKAARRTRVIEGQAVLEGLYRVIMSDNPWMYGNRPPSGSGAIEHYPGMSIEDQCKLPIAAHAMPNSVLFMWTTAPLILQNPGPRDVGEAWGYKYKQQIVWDKVDGTYSNYTGGNHEILTIWTRGQCTPDLPTDLPDSVQVIRKSDEHSAKPEEFRRLIEKHWTIGPYLELFGRERHDGWTVFGNDARLWPQQAEAQVAV